MELYLPNWYTYYYKSNRRYRSNTKLDIDLAFSSFIKFNTIISLLESLELVRTSGWISGGSGINYDSIKAVSIISWYTINYKSLDVFY
jgi:hypothetical protein